MASRSLRGILPVVLLIFVGSILAGCASTPRTFANQSPAGDFGNYRTYTFAERLGTDDSTEHRSLLSQYLIAEISAQMNSRGYSYAEADADLVFSLDLISQEKIRSTGSTYVGGFYGAGYPYYGGYGRYGYGYGYGYDGGRIIQYTEGTLTIGIVDNTTKQVVWEGVSISRITDEVRDNLELAVRSAVQDMFARYPHTAPGTPALAGSSAAAN